ncbi:MAG: aminotransferase class IV family protein, partial [Bacteroidetes bacterium]|nr:aminotransferase class IV family protein [Bacteroidota bacterium]
MNPPPLCFETICVQQRQFSKLLPYHQARLNRTRAALWPASGPIDLSSILTIPDEVGPEKYKCRVTYGSEIVNIEWEKYQYRTIQSLRLVESDSIDYAFKYNNREAINALHAQRGECDDVLIVKNGLITDTSYANVAFFDGTAWYTPAQPLLPGTQRAFLLDEGIIVPKEIRVGDLSQYQAVKLFNAMVEW